MVATTNNKIDRNKQYTETLCEKVNNLAVQIWNSDWLENNLKNIVANTSIIDETVIADIDAVIASEEVQLFKNDYDYVEEAIEETE